MSKETYYIVISDLLQCQKRPTTVSKEAYLRDNHTLDIGHKQGTLPEPQILRWHLIPISQRPPSSLASTSSSSSFVVGATHRHLRVRRVKSSVLSVLP